MALSLCPCSTRQEELQIALQVAHEVNGHLNREVEKLTLQVEALQQERDACLEHIKFLSHKMAEERRKAAVCGWAQRRKSLVSSYVLIYWSCLRARAVYGCCSIAAAAAANNCPPAQGELWNLQCSSYACRSTALQPEQRRWRGKSCSMPHQIQCSLQVWAWLYGEVTLVADSKPL